MNTAYTPTANDKSNALQMWGKCNILEIEKDIEMAKKEGTHKLEAILLWLLKDRRERMDREHDDAYAEEERRTHR